MSEMMIKSGQINNLRFEVNIAGSKAADPQVRFVLTSEDRSLVFPAKVSKGVAAIVVDATSEDLGKFTGYELEVIVGNNYFVPVKGAVTIEEQIKITARNLSTSESGESHAGDSGDLIVSAKPVKEGKEKKSKGRRMLKLKARSTNEDEEDDDEDEDVVVKKEKPRHEGRKSLSPLMRTLRERLVN